MYLTALAVGLLSLAAGQLRDKDGELTELPNQNVKPTSDDSIRYNQFLMPYSKAYSQYVKQQSSTMSSSGSFTSEVVADKSVGSEQGKYGMMQGDESGVLRWLPSAGTGFSIAFLAILSSLPFLAPRVRRWLSWSDNIRQQPLMEL